MPIHKCSRNGRPGYQWGSQKCYTGLGARKKAERQAAAIRASGYTENKVTAPNPLKIDPTRTITLRRSFVAGVSNSLRLLKGEVLRLVVDEDAFGLRPLKIPAFNVLNQRWKYRTQTEAVDEFEKWLRSRVDKALLSESEANKWRKYISSGFQRGAARAFDDTSKARKQLAKDQLREKGFSEGSREQFLRQAFAKPTAIEKLRFLQARALDEVKGLSRDLRTRAKRTLTEGLVRDLSPREIAAKLAKEIDVSIGKAETIAFTELVRAHADGQLEALEQLGVEEVGVAVEWSTAENPCPLCKPLEGVVLKLAEARGMLPRHPRCRCAWLPANLGEDTDEQKRGKYKIDQAVKQSVKREQRETGKKSDWGPAKSISRKRPVQNIGQSTEQAQPLQCKEVQGCTCKELEFSALFQRLIR